MRGRVEEYSYPGAGAFPASPQMENHDLPDRRRPAGQRRLTIHLKLPRFRGHPTVWVFGVHNGKEAPTLRAGIPPADD
jgi:hypothetical protein